MSKPPQHSDPTAAQGASDQRRGAFVDGGTFNGPVTGYLEHHEHHHHPAPQPAVPDLDAARALLDRLPLDEIPKPEALPMPHRMPLHPNQHFVGRTDELRRLAALLKTGGTVAITTGIGGMGKTQLAAEVAHRYGHYFVGGVFWVSCADPASIPAEVAACGLLMGLPLDGKDQQTQAQLTLAAWETDLPRLLIFDNCEDEALLRQWKPRTLGGARVLVTSRRATWTTSLKVQTLPLDVLPRAESVALLQQLAPDLQADEAGQIAEALGDLPLALFLSGRYLARYPTPVEEYLARLASVQLKHQALQGRGVVDWPTDRKPHVERAFALSFERLNPHDQTDILARALLARAACFAPGEPFGEWWLEATIEPEGDEEEQNLVFIDAVERLLDLGLLERNGVWLRLHRLLAAFTQNALTDTDALPTVERVVNAVASLANKTGVPQAMLPVLTHLRHLVQQCHQCEDETVAMLCNNLGLYLQIAGVYAEAYPLYERALAISERVLGSDHPNTAACLNNLAVLLEIQGAYEQALPLYERALVTCEQVKGSDHPDTATCLNNLAELYRSQGAYEQALPLYERALAILERVLGSDHPTTAQSLNNLAGLLKAQGAYEQALPLLKRALAISERVLGSDHPDTALRLNNLAALLEAQGKSGQALSLYKRALTVRERVLGSDHPDTAQSLNNLAGFYAERGQIAMALPLMERAVTICQARFGRQHPNTIKSQKSLAAIQRRAAVVADLPDSVRAALQTQDGPALQRALRVFPPEEAQAIVAQLQSIGILRNQLEQFAPLLQDIAAVAQGNDGPRTQIEAALAQLDQRGFHLTTAVQAIWTGQRDPATLTEGLDNTGTELIRRVLALLAEAEAAQVQEHAAFLARAQAAVAAAGPDPATRAALADRLHTAADAYTSGTSADRALAAQLWALAVQLKGKAG